MAAEFPAWIGGVGANLEVDDSDSAWIEFSNNGKGLHISNLSRPEATLNGRRLKNSQIHADQDYALLAGGHLILFSYCKSPSSWIESRRSDLWRIVVGHNNVLAGPLALGMLRKHAAEILEREPDAVLHQASCSTGFYLRDAMAALDWPREDVQRFAPKGLDQSPPELKLKAVAKPPPPAEPEINSDTGTHTCPACWLKFDAGDVMHIAAHASLRGDPILKEEEMLRFSATRFNNQGQALDAMGVPVTEIACPHCRRRLPPSFLDLKQHIVSIVGAPSSGKSYFLSVLVKMLQTNLFQHFDTAFYDGDPQENVRLTEMKNKLFSASSPSEATLAKTQLEGDMYIPVHRQGREVRMPKPFVFNVAPQSHMQDTFSVVFYDNAGEHFEPTRDSVTTPGAQHVAAASGLLFMFDPTYNLEFRKLLKGHADPQLGDQRFDQQDTLLAEMNARVKKLKSLDFRDRIDTPLAIVVGKSDVWIDRLGNAGFMNPLSSGILDAACIESNSNLARNLLMKVVPSIVANAEAISHNVRYFPVSAFGCSPEYVGDDPKTGRPQFSPDPNKIKPHLVEIPMLWLLSQFAPGVVPLGGKR